MAQAKAKRRWRLRRAGQVFLIIALLLLLAAWNTGLNLLYILLGALLSFLVLSVYFSARNLRRLRLVREGPAAVHRDEDFGVLARIENGRNSTSALCVHLESSARPGTSCGFMFKLPPRNEAAVTMSEKFEKRGAYALPPLDLVTAFPFGLIESRQRTEDDLEVVVYPRVFSVRSSALELISGGGEVLKSARGEGDEFFSLRDYIPGDDLRRVSWRATARAGELMVKELSQETSRFVVLVFDTRECMNVPAFHDHFENAVELVASLAVTLLNRQYSVALITGTDYLAEGEGQAQVRRILNFLARVQPAAADTPDPYRRGALIDDPHRAAYLCVSPDPVQWGTRAGNLRVLHPREVVYA